ncbi:hypothetical protein TcG_09388 [Trypanosoma cruzi]|nr:hypothetical protein TcG_09388 [Trypanosoma cruzi]
MCLLHLFCRGGLKCGKRGINTARCFGVEELLSFIIILIVAMISGSHPCLPRLLSLSGAAPWPSSCLQEEKHIASDETTRHVCGVQGGTYLRRGARIWMSCGTKRGFDCPTVTPFLESVLFLLLSFMTRHGGIGEHRPTKGPAHIHTPTPLSF